MFIAENQRFEACDCDSGSSSGTGHTGCFEAPAMFKRKGVYYALVSVCSCFGKGGAPVWVYVSIYYSDSRFSRCPYHIRICTMPTAKAKFALVGCLGVQTAAHPLGPYTRQAGLGNAEQSQQNYVFQVSLSCGWKSGRFWLHPKTASP